MIDFNCPKCGTEISADDERAGKRGRCPDCKESFAIPDAEPPRKKKPARSEDDDEAAAEAPRKRKSSRDDEDDDRPARRRRARGDEDEEADTETEPREFPTTVTIAGIAWIGFGTLILISLVILLLGMFVFAGAQKNGAEAGGVIGVGLCVGLVGGLFGAAFLFVGVQSVRGTANDTLGNGVGSIIFAFIQFGGATLNAGSDSFFQAGINGFCGFGLLAAGVLLMGRRQYKAWRKAERRRNGDRRR